MLRLGLSPYVAGVRKYVRGRDSPQDMWIRMFTKPEMSEVEKVEFELMIEVKRSDGGKPRCMVFG